MAVKITIIGLHQIGASIGMGLAPHKEKLQRTGIDPEPAQGQKWAKSNVYDHQAYNLMQAVADADAVVLALPADQVEKTLKDIADGLKSGAVVLDTSPLRQKSIQWAHEILPAERHFVSMTPIINPAYLDASKEDLNEAHADLFKNGAMVITSGVDTHPEALKFASDLCRLLDAHAYFSDPLEADSIHTAIDTLPKLAAAALVTTVTSQPGWADSERLAGMAFLKSSFAVDLFDEEKSLGKTAVANREHTLRFMNDLIANLEEIRDAVDKEDEDSLHTILEDARSKRETWLHHRTHANWSAYPEQPLPSVKDSIGGLIGIRPRKKKEEK